MFAAAPFRLSLLFPFSLSLSLPFDFAFTLRVCNSRVFTFYVLRFLGEDSLAWIAANKHSIHSSSVCPFWAVKARTCRE